MADPRFSQLPRGTVEEEAASVDSSQLGRGTVEEEASAPRFSQLPVTCVTSDPSASIRYSQMVRVVIENFYADDDFLNVCVIT